MLGGRFDDGGITRPPQVAQTERHRVRTSRGGDLVDKGLAGEHSKQVGQFLKGNAGLAQDRSQRAALEIPKPAEPEPNRDFERAPPSALRAILDDLPIHIRPNLPAARVQT